MIDATFVIFLSFLLFVGLVWYYGARPLVALLDQWVEVIREEIRSASETHTATQKQYTEALRRLESARKESQHLQDCAHEDFLRLRLQTEEEFRHLLSLTEKEYGEKTQQIFQEKLRFLHLEIFQHALLLFENRVQKEIDPSSLEEFNTQAIMKISVLTR